MDRVLVERGASGVRGPQKVGEKGRQEVEKCEKTFVGCFHHTDFFPTDLSCFLFLLTLLDTDAEFLVVCSEITM